VADAFWVCDHTGQAVWNGGVTGAAAVPDCRNGTGRWKRVADEWTVRFPQNLQANASYIDDRIAAYLEANPVTPSGPDGGCCTSAQLELLGVTPASVMSSVAFGMSVVVAMWGIGYVGGLAVRAIREA
jgi:hypothetical protein